MSPANQPNRLTSRRLLLGVAAVSAAAIAQACVSGHLERRENANVLARLASFVQSGAADIPVSAVVGTGWREVCAISELDLDRTKTKTAQERQKMKDIISHVGLGVESGEWYLALYGTGTKPERIIATHFVGFVANTWKPYQDLGVGTTEFCLNASEALLVRVPGHEMLALKARGSR